MSKIRRERCPQCGSMDVIKWGTRGGRRRFKCKNCDSMFTYRRKDVSKSNRFTWFRWWIVGNQSIKQISELSGYSTRQLSRWFNEYLDDYPTWKIQCGEKVNLLIDGTWFANEVCLIVYRDQTIKKTIFYRNYLKWYLYFNNEDEKKTGNLGCFVCPLPVFFSLNYQPFLATLPFLLNKFTSYTQAHTNHVNHDHSFS